MFAGKTNTTISLLWDASSDNVGVVSYNIYLDGVFSTSEVSPNHTAVGLMAGTSYNFRVSAVDAVGNESLLSGVLTVSTLGIISETLLIPVATGDDDAEEKMEQTGCSSRNSSCSAPCLRLR